MEQKQIQLPKAQIRQLEVKIQGITPLLTHAINDDILQEIEDKQTGKAKNGGNKGHKIRQPHQEYEQSKYIVDGKDCFPCIAFKKALMEAGKQQKMGTALRRSVIIAGEFVEINSDKPVCDRRGVKLGQGKSKVLALRYRAKYNNWSANLVILYEEESVTNEQVLSYLSKAGQVVGVGDFRPACDGNFGRFEIKEVKESVI